MTKKCIVCHSPKIQIAFKAKQTTYYRCSSCTHVFAFKVPNGAYEAYDHLQKYLRWKEYLYNIFERRCDDIAKFKPKGKILEVGCSVGFMLDVFKARGYTAQGLEPSIDGVKFCRQRGYKVYHGYLESKIIPDAPYDVIVLNHVFEHIPNLDKACQSIKKLLKKDGVVYIENPNFDSLEASIFQSRWRFLMPDEHYSQFSPASMSTILERNGFEILLLKTNSPIYDFHSIGRELWRCLRHDKKRFLYYGLEFPLATIEWVLNRGKGIEVIARKNSTT